MKLTVKDRGNKFKKAVRVIGFVRKSADKRKLEMLAEANKV